MDFALSANQKSIREVVAKICAGFDDACWLKKNREGPRRCSACRSRIKVFREIKARSSTSSFRDAPLGAGPESIRTIVVMDSGLVALLRPGMTRP